MEHDHGTGMVTTLVRHGNRVAVLLDLSVFESLRIDAHTSPHVELGGASIILTPTDAQKPKFGSALYAD